MTDAPALGATAILNPPQPTPIEQMTAEQAAARIDQLKADPAFGKRLNELDVAARDEWLRLWNRKSGNDLPLPQTPEEIYAARDQRIEREADTLANYMRGRGLTEEEIFEFRNNRPILQWEKEAHERKWERLQRSREWRQKWNDRDPEALRLETLNAYARRMPVARDLAEIQAWELKHYGKVISNA